MEINDNNPKANSFVKNLIALALNKIDNTDFNDRLSSYMQDIEGTDAVVDSSKFDNIISALENKTELSRQNLVGLSSFFNIASTKQALQAYLLINKMSTNFVEDIIQNGLKAGEDVSSTRLKFFTMVFSWKVLLEERVNVVFKKDSAMIPTGQPEHEFLF